MTIILNTQCSSTIYNDNTSNTYICKDFNEHKKDCFQHKSILLAKGYDLPHPFYLFWLVVVILGWQRWQYMDQKASPTCHRL